MKRHTRCFAILLLLIFSYSLYPDSAKEYEYLVQPGDKEYGKCIKHIYHYSDTNEIVKIDSYLEVEYSEETGFYRQIISFRDTVAYSFEMFQTDSMKEKSGLEKRIDYVDTEDNIIKVELFYADGKVFTFDEISSKILENYQLRKFSYYEGVFNETLPEDRAIVIEVPVFRGISSVENTGELAPLSEGEKTTIVAWMESHQFQDYSSLYQRKVLFREGEQSYWIAFQEEVIPSLLYYDEMLVNYYYIGGYGKDPIFLAISFFKK